MMQLQKYSFTSYKGRKRQNSGEFIGHDLNTLLVKRFDSAGESVSVNRGNIERYCIASRFLMRRRALAELGRRNEQ